MSDEPAPGFAELGDHIIDQASVRLLPRAFCERNRLVVLGKVSATSGEPITIGMVDPGRSDAVDFVRARFNREIVVVRLNDYEVARALGVTDTGVEDAVRTVVVRELTRGSTASAVDLVDALLWDAVHAGASDIHLEVYPGDVDVRTRVDGIMRQVFTEIHPENLAAVVARIKVLAEMDITVHRAPQDGRVRLAFVNDGTRRLIDFRVNVLPGPAGPDVVIRVLDPDLGLLALPDLGLRGADLETVSEIFANPEGLVIITGPTSSGKTTTLYSGIAHINDSRRKILTAEDPIEYSLPKVNQKQVSADLPMNTLMRALLRQNPDVLLFGEVRDHESAETAIGAANTGHLVLTTLHTSDAVGAVVRLRGLDIDDFDTASVLLAVVAQRLVRRICPDCIEETTPTEREKHLFRSMLDGVTVYRGRGCDACATTGYSGRLGIFEVLMVDEEIQDAIADGAHRAGLRRLARDRGFHTLFDDALDKVRDGVTTLDELLRVIPFRQVHVACREWTKRSVGG